MDEIEVVNAEELGDSNTEFNHSRRIWSLLRTASRSSVWIGLAGIALVGVFLWRDKDGSIPFIVIWVCAAVAIVLGCLIKAGTRPLIVKHELQQVTNHTHIRNLEIYVRGILYGDATAQALAIRELSAIVHHVNPIDQTRLSNEEIQLLVVSLENLKNRQAYIVVMLFRRLRDKRVIDYLHERELQLASLGISRELFPDEIKRLNNYRKWQQKILFAIGEMDVDASVTLLRSSQMPEGDSTLLRPAAKTADESLLRAHEEDQADLQGN